MAKTDVPARIGRGDEISVSGRHVGDTGRMGEILDVLGDDEHPHYLVRWADGRESVLYPSEHVTVVRSKGRRRPDEDRRRSRR
ncbi:MAG TPA: DUF1918 domain-containing protein [Gaiellaceae bacterium]|jgi:rRNA processing protein Gar1|nr:DUF1918 domain-containing protein [Gaiellaceae bacterium]